MNTKIDFSSGDVSLVSSYQSVADITETPDVMETTIEVVNPPQRISCHSTSDSTSTSETMDVSPTSPEQHVPNVEISSDGQQIKDVIESILLNGTPSPELTEPCFFPDAMENIMEVNKSCLTTKMTAEVGVISHCPQPNLKGKPRTSEQKQRKRLQNRNAATRYRCKKRSQQEALNNQCSELEEENQTLRKKIKSLEQETDYLKNLIADVFQKKADKKVEQKSKEIHA